MNPFFHPRQTASVKKRLTDTAIIYRDTDATPQNPNANTDRFAFTVKTNSPTSQTPTGARPVHEYKGLLTSTTTGNNKMVLGGKEVVTPWVLLLAEADTPDIKLGDKVHIGERVFSVIHPGGAETYQVLRSIGLQESGK